MKILALGDVIGRPGRQALEFFLSSLREEYSPDLIIVNGENSAGGAGMTLAIFEELSHKLGIDVITMGNHWMDKKEIYNFVHKHENIVLPGNMGNVSDPRKGLFIGTTKTGHRYAVANLIGRVFMVDGNKNPFDYADMLFSYVPASVRVRILDFHAETSSEKQALGQYLAGRVSLVYGTHTHTPTADHRILKNHTGFVTDVGMTGPYDSVIGIDTEASLRRFLKGEKKGWGPAKNDIQLHAILTEMDSATGQCLKIERIRRDLTPGG